jgi:ferredoxin-fold anticodon binding domain-containing protein
LTIEEIFIFSNSSLLEWRAELLDTILKGTHPGTIPARLGLIWFSGFRGEDLNVKVYDVRRMPSDGKSIVFRIKIVAFDTFLPEKLDIFCNI